MLLAAVAMAILLLAAVATAKHPSTTRDQIRPEQQLEGAYSCSVSLNGLISSVWWFQSGRGSSELTCCSFAASYMVYKKSLG